MTWALVLCRLFGHAWGGTTWEGLEWSHRKCRRCDLDQWTTLPKRSGAD